MNRVDEINAQIAKLEAEREDAMLTEKANVLAKIKSDIKLCGFKTSDFKGVLTTCKKRVTGTADKNTVAKKLIKSADNGKGRIEAKLYCRLPVRLKFF